jgi:hypothetical protein
MGLRDVMIDHDHDIARSMTFCFKGRRSAPFLNGSVAKNRRATCATTKALAGKRKHLHLLTPLHILAFLVPPVWYPPYKRANLPHILATFLFVRSAAAGSALKNSVAFLSRVYYITLCCALAL